MDAHGHTARQAVVVIGWVYAQLVQGVAALVDHGIHGVRQVVLLVVGGDAHILAGKVQGEGVLGLADGAVGAVQTQHLHQVIGKLPLLLHREGAVQKAVVDLGPAGDLPDDGHQPLPQNAEKPVQLFHGHAPLVFVEQCVIGRLGAVKIAGKFLLEGHQTLQHRAEQGKVRGLLGPVPHVAGLVGQLGIFHIFLGGDAGKLVIAPAQKLHLAGLLRGQPGRFPLQKG